LYRYIPQEPPTDLTALAGIFERLETRASPDGQERWMNWVVRLKPHGDCLGRVQVTIRADGSAYLAYEIGAAHWEKGFATEACQRIVRALFDDFRVVQIVAEVDTRNAASIRLLERLGFERAELRKAADFFKGESSDEFRYVLSAG